MNPSDYVTLVAAGVGAFLGSGSAFALEALRQRRLETQARHTALLNAQFALAMQLRTLVNTRDQYLDECRDHPQRFMRLVPFYGELNDPRVDFQRLGFVAAEDAAATLQAVHMAQDAYLTAFSALRVRNGLMEAIYTAATPAGDFDFDSGEGTVTMDARQARVLKGMTDSLYKSVDSAIQLEHIALSQLGGASKRLYPKKSVLAVEEIGSAAGV